LMAHPFSANVLTAACVMLVPGPRRRRLSAATGTITCPSALIYSIA